AKELGFNGVLVPGCCASGHEQHGREGFTWPGDTDRETVEHAMARLAAISAAEGLNFYMDVEAGALPWTDNWTERLVQWLHAGVRGFRCLGVKGEASADWRRV